MLLGVPILDTLLAVSRRAMNGRPLFRADRDHIHHRLLAVGLSHRQAVLVLYGVCVVFAGTALLLTIANGRVITLTLCAVALVSFVFLRRLGYMRFQSGGVLLDKRRRSRNLRALVRPFTERLRTVTTSAEIWEAVRDLAVCFDAHSVALHLDHGDSPDKTQAVKEKVTFSSELVSVAAEFPPASPPAQTAAAPEIPAAAKPIFRARFGLIGLKHDEGLLELAWADGRVELDRDTEIGLELFCDHVASAYERLRSRGDRGAGRLLKLPTNDR
jgi:UDP-GlcNAc:undecaprenyl-phosphate GlcNAc-1-phosphate transferase